MKQTNLSGWSISSSRYFNWRKKICQNQDHRYNGCMTGCGNRVKSQLPNAPTLPLRDYTYRVKKNIYQAIFEPSGEAKGTAARVFPLYSPNPSLQPREPGRVRDYRKRFGFYHLQGVWVKAVQGSGFIQVFQGYGYRGTG